MAEWLDVLDAINEGRQAGGQAGRGEGRKAGRQEDRKAGRQDRVVNFLKEIRPEIVLLDIRIKFASFPPYPAMSDDHSRLNYGVA